MGFIHVKKTLSANLTCENAMSRKSDVHKQRTSRQMAADIYADLRRKGELIGDADMLIAASALVHGLGVVTNNEEHFERIAGLYMENWLG